MRGNGNARAQKELRPNKMPSVLDSLDGNSFDISALMKRALQMPANRTVKGTNEEKQSKKEVAKLDAAAQPSVSRLPKAGPSIVENPAFSPEDSLQKAATKLANLKAPNSNKKFLTTPEAAPSKESKEKQRLAAMSALQKRERRNNSHKFGDWFDGDDKDLEETLGEFNDEEGSTEHKPGDSVVKKVQAMAAELCADLDTLIAPESAFRPVGPSLRQKLIESWEGKTYYDRLREIAGDCDHGEEVETEKRNSNPQEFDLGKQPSTQPTRTGMAGRPLDTMSHADAAKAVAAAMARAQTLSQKQVHGGNGTKPSEVAVNVHSQMQALKADDINEGVRLLKVSIKGANAQPSSHGENASEKENYKPVGQAAITLGLSEIPLDKGVSEEKLQAELQAALELLQHTLGEKSQLILKLNQEMEVISLLKTEVEAAEKLRLEEYNGRRAAEKKAHEAAVALAELQRRAEKAEEAAERVADERNQLEQRLHMTEGHVSTIIQATKGILGCIHLNEEESCVQQCTKKEGHQGGQRKSIKDDRRQSWR